LSETTIKDIAEKAGISISTVSHALNDTRYVNDVIAVDLLNLLVKENIKVPEDV